MYKNIYIVMYKLLYIVITVITESVLIKIQNGSGGDLYNRIVGKLNYISSKLMTIGYKSTDPLGKKHLGLTFPNPDISQICQVLRMSEEQFKERYKGQTVVWYDLEGVPHVRIDFIIWEDA
jgi:hypothetical protein